MKINEIIIPQEDTDPDLELTSFHDGNVSPEMAELLGHLSACDSINCLRSVLSIYMPELEDGSVE